MDLEIQEQNGVKIIHLKGDLDSQTANDVYEQLQTKLTAKDKVVLNLQQVPYMSSAGIRTLLLLYRSVLNNDGRIVLVNLQEPLQETLDITGFLEYFNTQDSLDAGLKAIT
jgi:anti-sigma B factor antagonist